MSPNHFIRSSACVAALLAGTTVMADVTAEEVWANWMAQMDVYGQDGISVGSQTYSGGVLTISGLSMNMVNEEMTVAASFDDITLTENGDGTVTVVMPEVTPITINPTGEAETDRIVATVRTVGAEMVVSGTPEAMQYDVSADRYSVTIDEALEDGEPMPLTLQANMNDVSSRQMVTEADGMRTTDVEMTAASFDILLAAQDGSEGIDMSGQVTNMALSGGSTMPLDYDPARPEEMFMMGFATDLDYTAGTSNFIMAVTDYSGTTNITSASSDSSFALSMDKENFGLGFGAENVAISVMGGQVPFPVDLSLAEYGASIDMPMTRTEEPVPFGMSINLTELAVNDMIWMMLDPGSMLPHDPATAQIDLTGTTKLFFDILDREQAMAMENAEVPGELHSLTLNDLNLSIAGAMVSGQGSFEFDNSDMMTFGGMPRPEGKLELEGKGLNGLMDTLVAMGYVPEEQVMGFRMMMGMFATVVGDDHLTSTLEVNSEAHVLVNGQRIQ
ncbi:DUF2125 domain-containing protein [Loktanella sp. IMCC34160]|uniref:DUF2125 domain-containing protein n=1 Tax=Loktanella sp. IMCC34160 TaxID=2510646 RepID=UPI00101B81BC|nr:DUF2125 domain-containing protein [Loktanella sp. IMCC34160]RYG91111.1 DUF2125 domain-containing protein [Loktanella sp. IMCC34160]